MLPQKSDRIQDILSIMKLEPDSCASSAVVSSPDKARGREVPYVKENLPYGPVHGRVSLTKLPK